MSILPDHLDVSPFLGLEAPASVPSGAAVEVGMSFSGDPFVLPSVLRQHGFICGSTGRGKTYLATVLVQQLARKNGIIFLDPKGSAVERLYRLLMDDRACRDRVIYWDITSKDHVIGYNPFKRRPSMSLAVQVDLAVEACLRVWKAENTTDTPTLARRLPTLFEILIQTGHTFLEAMDMCSMTRKDKRGVILDQARASGMADFKLEDWEYIQSLKSEKAIRDELLSVYNRIYGVIKNDHARLILGQTENALDIQEVMDKQQILLVNLNASEGEDLSNLIAMLVLNEVAKLAPLRRGATKEQDCYVFCDEYSRIATKSVSDALPFTREYGVFFWLMTQYLGQLGRDDREQRNFLHAIQANCDFKAVLGGCAPSDCEILVDTVLSAQLNLQQPKLSRTFFAPIQKWMTLVSETLGSSESTTNSSSWFESDGASEGITQSQNPRSGDTASSTSSQSRTTGRGSGTSRTYASNQSKTFSEQLVTFYERCQEVAQYWGLEEQKHRAKSLLQKLPQAVAVMEHQPELTKVVFVKWLRMPAIRASAARTRWHHMNRWPCIRSSEAAKSHTIERRRKLFERGNEDESEPADSLGDVFS